MCDHVGRVRVLMPESSTTLKDVEVVGSLPVISAFVDAHDELKLWSLTGEPP